MWKSEGRARARKGERKNTGYTSIISTEWNQNAGYLIWCCVNSHYRHLCSYDHWLWLFVFFSGAALYLRFFPHLPSEGCSILSSPSSFSPSPPLSPRQSSSSPSLFAKCLANPLCQLLIALCTAGPHPPGSVRCVQAGPHPDRFRTASAALSLYFDCFLSDRCRSFRTDSGPRVLGLACILLIAFRTVADLSGPQYLHLACNLNAEFRAATCFSGPMV